MRRRARTDANQREIVAVTRTPTFPALPVRLNVLLRKHWSARHQEQERWNQMARVAWLALPKSQRVAIDPAVVTLTFISPRKRDADGLAKCVLDALVHSGFIVDDGPPHLVELRLRSERGKAETRVVVESADDALRVVGVR